MYKNFLNTEKIIIAGPCAFESREQFKDCARVLKDIGIKYVRASLWKPRTQPGWDGFGWMGLPIIIEESIQLGLIPATEIITAEHAQMVVEALDHYGPEAQMLVWLGSRNQNHIEQKKISQILAHGSRGIVFMFKNQMWDNEKHWLGIYEHILSGGFPSERLIACHRGFAPGKSPNPKKYRNIPDFEMAMRIKEETGLKMVIDPSHIGGNVDNTIEVCHISSSYNFDGFIIEAHNDPTKAKTDADQQLTPDQLHKVLKMLNFIPAEEKVA